jgi:hypothetical protein
MKNRKNRVFLCCFCLFLFTTLLAQNEEGWQQKIKELDQQIQELVDEKSKYKARADRHQDEGDRWQFEPDRMNDAFQAWKQADLDRKKENELEQQIKDLKEQKQTILKEHGTEQ